MFKSLALLTQLLLALCLHLCVLLQPLVSWVVLMVRCPGPFRLSATDSWYMVFSLAGVCAPRLNAYARDSLISDGSKVSFRPNSSIPAYFSSHCFVSISTTIYKHINSGGRGRRNDSSINRNFVVANTEFTSDFGFKPVLAGFRGALFGLAMKLCLVWQWNPLRGISSMFSSNMKTFRKQTELLFNS